MRAETIGRRSPGEARRETGEAVKGPRQHELRKERNEKVLAEAGPGEDRTPDRRIGQIAHAEHPKQLYEDKPGREPGNELSGRTDPARKKAGAFR